MPTSEPRANLFLQYQHPLLGLSPGSAKPLNHCTLFSNYIGSFSIHCRLAHIELNYNARTSGEYSSVTEEIELANQAYKMKGCYEWFKQEKEGTLTEQKNWNQLSIGKLLTGR
jgi:hypothetical protein